jgi:hypothetical protein|tara:strand:+ start:363 stop:764 length:402 start_codon:yes stop_codon:yes gene_type:complete
MRSATFQFAPYVARVTCEWCEGDPPDVRVGARDGLGDRLLGERDPVETRDGDARDVCPSIDAPDADMATRGAASCARWARCAETGWRPRRRRRDASGAPEDKAATRLVLGVQRSLRRYLPVDEFGRNFAKCRA